MNIKVNTEQVAAVCVNLESIMYRAMMLVREIQSMLSNRKILEPCSHSKKEAVFNDFLLKIVQHIEKIYKYVPEPKNDEKGNNASTS